MTSEEWLAQNKRNRVICEFYEGHWANFSIQQCLYNRTTREHCARCKKGERVKIKHPTVPVPVARFSWGNPYPNSQTAQRMKIGDSIAQDRARRQGAR